MSFPIITLSKWNIHLYNDFVYLSGIADNHPKLGKNTYIAHTSGIQKVIAYSGQELRVETYNSVYICPYKYMNNKPCKNKIENVDGIDTKLLEVISFINNFVDNKLDADLKIKIDNLLKSGVEELRKNKNLEENRLKNIVKELDNSIYLEVSNINEGDTLAYNVNGEIGVIYPEIHVGMFQDSILYIEDYLVDFRYFPKGTLMQIYSWSDNIEHLYIKNLKNYEIKVDKQIIKPDEIIEIKNENYNPGLISPNCVDGSSIFSMKEQ